MFTTPKRMHDLLCDLLENGWAYAVTHGTDTGGSPYVTVEGRTQDQHIIVTWHTRTTGTYRLFHAMHNKRDATLSSIFKVIYQGES